MNTNNSAIQAKNTEYAVLSLMLKHSSNIAMCTDLSKEDFYDENCCAVYETIMSFTPFMRDKLSLSIVADRVGLFSDKISFDMIKKLSEVPSHSDNLDNLKKTLKEKSGERKLLASAQKIMEISYDQSLSFEDKLGNATSALTNLSYTVSDKTTTYAEAQVSVLEFIKHKKANPLQNLMWGISRLDDLTGGIPNDLTILGAMTGLGKTAFVTNLAESLSDADKKVYFVSAEMNAEEVVLREIQRGTGIQVTKMRTGDISDNELHMIESFVPAKNVFINDASNADIDRVCSAIKVHKLKYGLDIIIVDYLQLLTTTKHKNDPINQVKYISNSLKALSKDLKVPVVALAQFNKEAGKAIDRKPEIGNLRDSSQIAMDAGLILFIHRQDYFDKEIAANKTHRMNGVVELIIAKNRYGVANTSAYCQWIPNRAQFSEFPADWELPVFEGDKETASGFKKKTLGGN